MPPEVIKAKVSEMKSLGWTLLNLRSDIGAFCDKPGVTLKFVRVPNSNNES